LYLYSTLCEAKHIFFYLFSLISSLEKSQGLEKSEKRTEKSEKNKKKSHTIVRLFFLARRRGFARRQRRRRAHALCNPSPKARNLPYGKPCFSNPLLKETKK